MFVKGAPRVSICCIGASFTFVFLLFAVGATLTWFNRAQIETVSKIQNKLLEDKVDRANYLLQAELLETETLARSLLASDDIGGLLSDGGISEWSKQTLVPLLNSKGRYRRVDSFTIYDGEKIVLSHNPPERLDDPQALSSDPITASALAGDARSSFVLSKGSLYAISAVPIVSLYEQGEVTGILLVGRKLESSLLSWYRDLMKVDFALVTDSQVDYPINRQHTFTPPFFPESVKAAQMNTALAFGDVITRTALIKGANGEILGVLWVVVPSSEIINGSWLGELDGRQIVYISLACAGLGSVLAYLFLLFLVRRPIRRALFRMSSDHLVVDEGDLDTFIEEIRSVKKAVRRLQDAVSQGKEVRKTILHSISEGFQLLDPQGRTLEVNPAMCNLAGVNRERFLRESMPFFYLNEEGRDLGLEFLELVRQGEVNIRRGFESELSWSDGEHKGIKVRLCTVEDDQTSESHICVFVAGTDTQGEQQFNIHELGKMTLLVKFAGSIAHNMNNILSGILSAVSLIERGKVNPETQGQLIRSMREAVSKGTSLCSELLHMSKVRQARNIRRPVDIGPLVTDVVRMAAELPEAIQHEIKVNLPTEPRLALCDDSGFHHVLLNLVLNALDAMPEPGVIDVSVEYDLNNPESAIVIKVRDTGLGMEPEVQKMIFSPFFTTKKAARTRKKTFGGTGLGLASALDSIQSWGGSIECQSELGKGTTFIITLQPASSAGLPVSSVSRES